MFHIASREIGADVEFTGISRRLDRLKSSKKRQFITHVWPAAPANENRRVCFKILAVDFGLMQSHQEAGVTGRFDFWFGRDDSGYARRTRLCSGDLGERICWCVDDSLAVEREKCRPDHRKDERRIAPAQPGQCACERNEQDRAGDRRKIIGRDDTDDRSQDETEKWLPHQPRGDQSLTTRSSLTSYRSIGSDSTI